MILSRNPVTARCSLRANFALLKNISHENNRIKNEYYVWRLLSQSDTRTE